MRTPTKIEELVVADEEAFFKTLPRPLCVVHSDQVRVDTADGWGRWETPEGKRLVYDQELLEAIRDDIDMAQMSGVLPEHMQVSVRRAAGGGYRRRRSKSRAFVVEIVRWPGSVFSNDFVSSTWDAARESFDLGFRGRNLSTQAGSSACGHRSNASPELARALILLDKIAYRHHQVGDQYQPTDLRYSASVCAYTVQEEAFAALLDEATGGMNQTGIRVRKIRGRARPVIR